MNRRRFLKTTGSSVTLSELAGCAEAVNGPGSRADRGGERNESSDNESTRNRDNGNTTHRSTETHGHNGGIGGPVAHADVAMITNDDGYHFDPHVVWITKGGTVTWTLESGSHTTTAYHPQSDKPLRIPKAATAWDSGVLTEEGATFEQTFEVEGVYDYFCIPHEYRGMVGSLLVGRPDTREQPGLAPPQESLPQEAQAKIETLNAQVEEALNQPNTDDTQPQTNFTITMNSPDTDRISPQSVKTDTTSATLNRRAFLGTLGVAGLGILAGCTSADQGTVNFETGGNDKQLRQAAATFLGSGTMYKAPNCNWCLEYKQYLESTTEATIDVVKVDDLARIKNKYTVPRDVESCHTLDSGEYFIEGHVPREAIGKLALEESDILGIALPDMPVGSPGMSGQKSEEFVIYAVENDGSSHEFMRI